MMKLWYILPIMRSWWYGQVITYPALLCITGRCKWQLSLCSHQEVTVGVYCHFTEGHLFSKPVLQENGGHLHWQLIYNNKFLALMSLYGVEKRMDLDRGWNPSLPFKQYLRLLLRRDFWGDGVVLYVMSCMWSMKITILNMETLQEHRIHHDRVLDEADMVLSFNVVNHFNAAGK